MKIFIGLLALALIAYIESASVSTRRANWKVGETYVYKYQTIQVSSIPLLSNEHTGVSIWTDVSLYVQNEDTFVLKFEHPVLRVLTSEGERLAPISPSETIKLPYSDDRVYKNLDQEVEKRFTEELKKTVKFNMNRDQVIGDIWADETDSVPSLDIKKGFINLLPVHIKNAAPINNNVNLSQTKINGSIYSFETTKFEQCTTSYELTRYIKSERYFRVSTVTDPTKCESQVEQDLLKLRQNQTKSSELENFHYSDNLVIDSFIGDDIDIVLSSNDPESGKGNIFTIQNSVNHGRNSNFMEAPNKQQKTSVQQLIQKKIRAKIRDSFLRGLNIPQYSKYDNIWSG